MRNEFTKQVIKMINKTNIKIEETGFLDEVLNSSKTNNSLPVKLNMLNALISGTLVSIKHITGDSNE